MNQDEIECPFNADCECCPLGLSPVECQGIEESDIEEE